jgi:sugar phosphate isomerase/epimerase
MNKTSIKSAVTFSAVPEAQGGPFVYWGQLQASLESAKKLRFHALEIFPPGPEYFQGIDAGGLAKAIGLEIAAVGTGAGWVRHKLSLADPDAQVRSRAMEFLMMMLDVATKLSAPMIIGSMQGRSGPGVTKMQAKEFLREGLERLDAQARQIGGRILYEPLNRYETDQCNTLAQGSAMIQGLFCTKLLADWFHMNIEEADMADSIRKAGAAIGHIHFADSNRQAIGLGHLRVEPLIDALRSIGYCGYLSAEVFPLPDSDLAATQTIRSFEKFAELFLPSVSSVNIG